MIEHITAAKIQKYFEKKTFIKEKTLFTPFFYTKRMPFRFYLIKKNVFRLLHHYLYLNAR